MDSTGQSGSAATPAPAAGSAAGAGPGAAGTAAPSAGSSGASGARPPVTAGAAGSAMAGAPAGGSVAPTAGTGVAGMVAAGASGMTGAAGATAGQGAMAGVGGEMSTPPVTCSASQTGKAGRTMERLENAGVTRNYILNVPDSYTGDEPVPLVLYFHPLLTNASTAEGSSMFTQLSSKEGFIVAYPDGQESAAWNVGPCCTQSRDVDDVGFAKAIVEQVKAKYCVDTKRVYAAGFSMGAGMAHYLGCEASDVFAAIATGAFDLFAENTCAPTRPVPVISYRSQSDAIVPYEGGVKQSAPNGFVGKHTFLGAEGTFKKWAEINGCTGEPMSGTGGCQLYNQCKAGVEVKLCTVGGGHTWPDADGSWEFISRFSMP